MLRIEERRLEAVAQKLYAVTKAANLVPSQTYGNASTKEPYVLPKWSIRAGAGEISANGRGT